jgi:hypothetical protein
MDEQLLNAYRSTCYTVDGLNLTIRIGTFTPALDQLLAREGLTHWAYITAWNPCSQVLSDEANRLRFLELKRMDAGYCCYEGLGIGEDPAWQREKSLLILGIPREEACLLGNHLDQNAIVAGTVNEPGELLLLV